MRVVVLHTDPLFVPRFDLVPLLVARSGDVVRACPTAAPVSPVPKPHTAAVAFLHNRCRRRHTGATADDGCRFDSSAAGGGGRSEPVQTGHGHGHRLLVSAAIVVELQRFADFCHQRVHFFGVDGDGLLQKDVVFLPTRHCELRVGVLWVLLRVFLRFSMNESRRAAPRSHHAAEQ